MFKIPALSSVAALAAAMRTGDLPEMAQLRALPPRLEPRTRAQVKHRKWKKLRASGQHNWRKKL